MIGYDGVEFGSRMGLSRPRVCIGLGLLGL